MNYTVVQFLFSLSSISRIGWIWLHRCSSCDSSSLWKDWMVGGEKEGRGRKEEGEGRERGKTTEEEEGGRGREGGTEVYFVN